MSGAERVKVGTAHRIIMVFRDSTGARKTGLTVTMRIRRKSDGKYLKNDATWTASPSTEYTATETDSTNMPGWYHFDFTLPATEDTYYVSADGSSTLIAANRYQEGEILGVKLNEADIHKFAAFMLNKVVQNIGTGLVDVYDDDGVTVLYSLDIGQDDPATPTERIVDQV